MLLLYNGGPQCWPTLGVEVITIKLALCDYSVDGPSETSCSLPQKERTVFAIPAHQHGLLPVPSLSH
ncbi:MAG: hypothetical protein ACKER6_00200 [Candidatus Hodgkinia cicadicola]